MSDPATAAATAFAPGGSGVLFTLYSAQPFNPAAVTVSKICMQYQQPAPNNRLGSIVWRDAAAAASMGNAAPVQGMLRCEMISDVFLGCQSEAFRSSAAANAVEDRCFSLVSRMGSLDLEAASMAESQAWLSKLSAIINDSGKDIVLSAGEQQQQQQQQAPPAAITIPAKTIPDAAAGSDHWKVSVDEPKKDSPLQNGAAGPKSAAPVADVSAHALMVSGQGQPFLFHYLSADSKQLTRARTLLTFVSTKSHTQPSGGYFLLKTVAPSLRPTCPHACVTEPHAFHSNSADPDEHSGELCIWEARIALDVLCDVFVGSEHGLFASCASLRGLDSSRCVSLVSDESPLGVCWDLEAPSGEQFIEWLNAFNAILQTTDQEIAVQSAAVPSAVEGPGAEAAPAPASSSLDLLRAGSYFYLYSAAAATTNGSAPSLSSSSFNSSSGSGGLHKRLILMFFNDDVSRPLFFAEQSNAIADPQATPLQQRCSLFYRYVQEVAPQSSTPLSPRPTDECISIYSISDFLLGKQTSLLCLNPLASFAANSACFSLMLSRLNPETQRLESEELGLECVNPAEMAGWLDGIMEVSNGGPACATPPSAAPAAEADKDVLPLLSPQKSLPSIASYILPPGQHKPSSLIVPSTPANVIPTEPVWSSLSVATDSKSPNSERVDQSLLSIEHVVSSPRINALPPRDPVLLRLAAGVACSLWSNYAAPERSAIWLFYAAVGSGSSFASEGGAAKKSQGGYFFWNYLSAEQMQSAALQQMQPASDSPLFKQCSDRCFNVDDVSSVYLGKLASIFAHPATASASAGCLLSILTSDDLLNMEFARAAERARFLADLRELFRANLAKNLIKVDFQEDSPAAAAAGASTAAAASMEGQELQHGFEVTEWFNLQEGAYPLQLAQQQTPLTAAITLPSSAVTPATESLSPTASCQALCEFARGMEFVAWSFAPNSDTVQQVPITLFFQQTPEDHVIFFVWVPRNLGTEADPNEVAKAKAWSRSIKHSRELAFGARKGSPFYPHLAVSAISDLHIGKNLPIFTASALGTKLLADECVSIVASAEGAAGSVASAATLAVPIELHLVATRGIAQIARIISAVTTLLEMDGMPVDESLRRVLRLGEGMPFDNVQTLPAAALMAVPPPAAAAAASPSEAVPAQLQPLRNGSVFWLWKFANQADASAATAVAAPRAVTRQKVMLKWTPNAELGELAWTSAYGAGSAARPATSGSMLISSISDMFIGAEAQQFAPSCMVTSLDAAGRAEGAASTRVVSDDASFSIISMDVGNELHLESEVAGSPADIKTVQDWVEGLTFLLQSGGRSLTEEPASSSLPPEQQQQAPAPVQAAPTAEAEGRSSAAALVVASNSPVLKPVAAVVVAPLPPLSTPATVAEILAVVQVLQAAIKDGKLAAYTEQQLDGVLAAIRDAAATQPPESMEVVMSSGAAAVVTESMRLFPSSDALQLTGAGACWCLATTEKNEALVVAAGGLEQNRLNLARHPNNAMLLQQVCGAIRNLTVADPHKAAFCAGPSGEKACADLVSALRTHAGATALAQQASGSIAALAMWAANKGVLGAAGAIPAVVHAMSAHPGADEASAQLHEESCAALRNLAANHAANKDAIAACGGIEAIVISMRTHLLSPVNQLHAAGALWNVPANNASNKARVAQCGGIQCLLAALTTHPDDSEVQLECIGALRNLSTLVENKPLILGTNAIPVILASMRRMMAVALLQEQACALTFNLSNYAHDAGASVMALIQQDAPATVLQVLQTHMSSAHVVEEASAALWIMHKAATGVSWPESFRAQVLSLADQALATHAGSQGVFNFATGMKAAWSQPDSSAGAAGADTAGAVNANGRAHGQAGANGNGLVKPVQTEHGGLMQDHNSASPQRVGDHRS